MAGKKLRRFFIEDIDESKGYVEIKGEEFFEIYFFQTTRLKEFFGKLNNGCLGIKSTSNF